MQITSHNTKLQNKVNKLYVCRLLNRHITYKPIEEEYIAPKLDRMQAIRNVFRIFHKKAEVTLNKNEEQDK